MAGTVLSPVLWSIAKQAASHFVPLAGETTHQINPLVPSWGVAKQRYTQDRHQHQCSHLPAHAALEEDALELPGEVQLL